MALSKLDNIARTNVDTIIDDIVLLHDESYLIAFLLTELKARLQSDDFYKAMLKLLNHDRISQKQRDYVLLVLEQLKAKEVTNEN